MSIVIILFCGVYLLIDNNDDDIVQVSIDDNGVTINAALYEYAKIASFGVIYDNNVPILLRLHLVSKTQPQFDIHLPAELHAPSLRTFLQEYIQESEQNGLSLLDRVLRILQL